MLTIGIAIVTMIAAVLAQNMGLTEAVSRVIGTVLRCPKCLSFWSVLAVLTLTGYNPLASVAIALLCAYLSHYVGLLLYYLNNKYNQLWERMGKGQKSPKRSR